MFESPGTAKGYVEGTEFTDSAPPETHDVSYEPRTKVLKEHFGGSIGNQTTVTVLVRAEKKGIGHYEVGIYERTRLPGARKMGFPPLERVLSSVRTGSAERADLLFEGLVKKALT